MNTQILFEIPTIYEAAIKSGSLIQIGGLLKDSASGQIVAHLQESGLAHSLISQTILGTSSPITMGVSGILNTGSGIYSAVQIHQVKAMVEGLQALQIATLGVSLVGIGVSVAGFVYMHKRLNQLDGKIDQLIDTVNAGFENLHRTMLRSHLSQVNSLIKQAKQAPHLSKPENEYTRIAELLAGEASYFEGELEFIMKVDGKINLELFWQLAQILMACNSVRIDCRLRTNEMRNALTLSESAAYSYQEIFGRLTPISFNADEQENSLILKTLKDITDVAATKPFLIDYLLSQKIDGQNYLEQIENEKERPILMLKVL
jgi:hypothetical protein